MKVDVAINLDEISDDLSEATNFLNENGVRFAEIRTVGGKNIADFTEDEVKNLKKYLSDNGLKVSAIASPLFKWYPEGNREGVVAHDNHKFSPEVSLSQKEQYIANVFHAAEFLETDKVRVFSNLRQPGVTLGDFFDDRLFVSMVEEAERRRIQVMLENEPPCIIYKKSDYLEVFRRFNSKYLKAWVDVANFYHEGENVDLAYLELLKEHLGYLHIKDFDGPRTLKYVPIGSGFINYKRIFSDLERVLDANIFGSIETHVKEDKVNATKVSLDLVNRILQNNGRRIRYALVGTGKIAKKHAVALRQNDNSEFRCVLDVNEEGAANFAEENDVIQHSSLGELLDDPDVDVVNICTPHRTHLTIAKQAIDKGKIVLSEKPFAINSADLEEYLTDPKARESTYVVFQYLFNPPVVELLENLEKIGKVEFFAINIRWWREDAYFKDWHGKKAESGGSLYNQSIHLIQLLSLITGLDVESVRCISKTLREQSEVEDISLATVKMKSGAFGYIETCLFTHKLNLEYSLFVTGTEGSVKIGGPALNEGLHFYPSEAKPTESSSLDAQPYGRGHVKLIGALSDKLLGNDNPKAGLLFKAAQLLPITRFIEEIYRNSEDE